MARSKGIKVSQCVVAILTVVLLTMMASIYCSTDAFGSSGSSEDSTSSSTIELSAKKGPISEGSYAIIAKSNSKRVQVKSAKTNNGATVALAKKAKSAKQKWYFKQASKSERDLYTIQSVQSGRYLTASDDHVVESKRSSNDSQIWQVEKKSGVFTFKNKGTGEYLSVSGGSALALSDEDDLSNQGFKVSESAILANGTYYIQSKSSKKVLGVTGHLTKVGSNVALLKKSGSASKKWVATQNSDGTYSFRNANSARALSVSASKARRGSNVNQGHNTGSKTKRWRLVPGENGGINVVSASNDKVFLGSSSLKSGSNVKMVKSGKSKTATFKFTKAKKPSNRSAMERKIRNKSSKTGWMLVANTKSCFVGVFKGKKGAWTPYAYFPCTPGAPGSPSKKGTYTVGLKGYSFGTSSYTCYYYTQYSGNYLFHSILYNQGTRQVQDGRMSVHASHGCIRLEIANAKWINQNIPKGSTVYVY